MKLFTKTFNILLLSLLAGCMAANPVPMASNEVTLPTVPAGFQVEMLPYSFVGPTQFFVDGTTLWVAQINGGENEKQGQILQIDLGTEDSTASTEPLIFLDGLDKPTGIALLEDELWVATRDGLLKAPLSDPGRLTVMLSDLPNNGRSNGTLTVTPAGQILYETSGNSVDADSGKLWAFDPSTGAGTVVARGLKGGYAHAYDEAGRLWITEIGDGSVDGVMLPDEINLVVSGADFGWPRCYGRELAGPDCAGVRPAVIAFAPHSTPTSLALSPFAPDTLLVALWLTGEVVAVSFEMDGDNAIGQQTPFLSGLRNPQHLFVVDDQSLLVSDFAQGRIVRIIHQN